MHRIRSLLCIIVLMGSCLSLAAMGMMVTPMFSMDTVNPLVTVISPNGGEMWLMNTSKNITWSASDSHLISNPITVDLSTDNGEAFSILAADESNDGTYPWTIPVLTALHSIVKVIAVDSFGNVGYDVSDGSFSLPGTTISITSLFPMDTINPTADLLTPNGGEAWYIGVSNDITWSASDNHLISLPIKLEYKKVSSGIWTTIQPDLANNGTYSWQMPTITSVQTLVRLTVSDAFGNTSNDISQNPFSISYVPPKPPQVRILIVLDRDAEISWSPVTETILGGPIVPSAYLIWYNSTADSSNTAAYYYLGETETATSYTHHNVARRAKHMFYRVTAVVDYDRKLSAVLAGMNRKEEPISWLEFKRRLAE